MLKCENIESQLSAYLDREMPPWKIKLIRWHLKRCPNCAHTAMRLQQTDKILRQLDPVKTSDGFLSDVLRKASTISVIEKHQIPWRRRVIRRVESSLALTAYSLRNRARPYALTAMLMLVMSIVSVATLYQPKQLPSENPPLLAQSPSNRSIVLVEIVSLDQPPKPHLSVHRQSTSHANP